MPENYHKQHIAVLSLHIPMTGAEKKKWAEIKCNPQDNTQQTEYSKEDGTTVWKGMKTSRSENSRLASGKAAHAYKSKFATNLLLLGFLGGKNGLFVSPCQSLEGSGVRLIGRTGRVSTRSLNQNLRAISILIDTRALKVHLQNHF